MLNYIMYFKSYLPACPACMLCCQTQRYDGMMIWLANPATICTNPFQTHLYGCMVQLLAVLYGDDDEMDCHFRSGVCLCRFDI